MYVGFKIQQTKQMDVFFHSLDEGFTVLLKCVSYKTSAGRRQLIAFLFMQGDHMNEGTQSLVSGLSFMLCALRLQKNIREPRKNRLAWLCSPFLMIPLELL